MCKCPLVRVWTYDITLSYGGFTTNVFDSWSFSLWRGISVFSGATRRGGDNDAVAAIGEDLRYEASIETWRTHLGSEEGKADKA